MAFKRSSIINQVSQNPEYRQGVLFAASSEHGGGGPYVFPASRKRSRPSADLVYFATEHLEARMAPLSCSSNRGARQKLTRWGKRYRGGGQTTDRKAGDSDPPCTHSTHGRLLGGRVEEEGGRGGGKCMFVTQGSKNEPKPPVPPGLPPW